MQTRNLYIGIFVILITLSLSFIIDDSFGITGRLGSAYRTCVESDRGDDYNATGKVVYTVRKNTKEYTDYCFSRTGKASNNWLNEYYCTLNEEVSSRDYNCKSYGGVCLDGRCIYNEEPCDDSDGGLNYEVKGKACAKDICKTDLCLDEDYVSEAYCDNGVKQKIYECKNGCSLGVCA